MANIAELMTVGTYATAAEAHVGGLALEQVGIRVFQDENQPYGAGLGFPADGVKVRVGGMMSDARWRRCGGPIISTVFPAIAAAGVRRAPLAATRHGGLPAAGRPRLAPPDRSPDCGPRPDPRESYSSFGPFARWM